MGRLKALFLVCCLLPLLWTGARAKQLEQVTIKRLGTDLDLIGYFAIPDKKPPYPAVVFLHGCSGIGIGGGLKAIYGNWIRELTDLGIAVLALDSATPRGFGSTCGPRPERKVMYFERPGDAYSSLAYLQTRPEIIPDKIGLIGWSQGGGITLLTISEKSIGRPKPSPRHDFAAAIAFYPSACSDKMQSKPYTDVEPNGWATVAPLLVLHGEDDNWTPYKPCKSFIKAAKRRGEAVDIIGYKGAVHSFDAPFMQVHERKSPRLRDGSLPLVGTNDEARQDSLIRVKAYLKEYLRP